MKIEMSDWLLFFFAHLNINNIILSSVVHAWLKVASIAKKKIKMQQTHISGFFLVHVGINILVNS